MFSTKIALNSCACAPYGGIQYTRHCGVTMKRAVFLVAALCATLGSAWAQDAATDTQEDFVLQQARDKYSAETSTTTSDTAGTVETEQAPDSQPAAPDIGDHPYTPIVLGFVPGISFPFGVFDTSMSAAAIGALSGSVNGLQGAGVFNIADGDIRGLQAAGIFNITDGDIRGLQAAGIFNIVEGDVRGTQGAGIFNIAKHVNGLQAAGIFNISGTMHGVQAAGIVNIADKASGTMIGLINIADELDGVAIGLVNIIGNGINDVSIDYQFDSGMAYATWRSGTPGLYASFFAGQPAAELLSTTDGLTVGAALGHRFRLFFLTADIELGAETPMDPASFDRIVADMESCKSGGVSSIDPWEHSFGTMRASLGLGKRRDIGPYLGIKADFAPTGSDSVPENLRYAFGSVTPYTVRVFGTQLDIWPKWFIGIKF